MRYSCLSVLLAISSIASANAKPARPPAAFAKATTYQSCATSTMFMCGMRDAGGHTYGTAKQVERCTRYTFLPDGTYTTTGDWPGPSHGRYRLRNGTITLTEASAEPTDPAPTPYDLELRRLTLVKG